jgi:hypothetical protein
MKIRRPYKKAGWAHDDKQIQQLLLRSFPRMHTNSKQRKRAGRWLRVINLYWRQQWSRGDIAAELGLKYNIIKNLIRAIRRAAAGRRSDTGKPIGKQKGRPWPKKAQK